MLSRIPICGLIFHDQMGEAVLRYPPRLNGKGGHAAIGCSLDEADGLLRRWGGSHGYVRVGSKHFLFAGHDLSCGQCCTWLAVVRL